MKDLKDFCRQLAIDVRKSVKDERPSHCEIPQKEEIGAYRGLCQLTLDDYGLDVLVVYAVHSEPSDPGEGTTLLAELPRVRQELAGLGLEELACHVAIDEGVELDDVREGDEGLHPCGRESGYSLVLGLQSSAAPSGAERSLTLVAHQLAQLLWGLGESGAPVEPGDESAASATSVEMQEESNSMSDGLTSEAETAQQQSDPQIQTEHKQVSIRWMGHEAEVDAGIADLILVIWMSGIDTLMSCQETEPGRAWIEFPTVQDALKFLNRVAVHPTENYPPIKDTLYGRIIGAGSKDGWDFSAFPDNWAVEEEVWDGFENFTRMGDADFDFAVGVWFPTTDIPLVTATLTGSNKPPTDRAPDRSGKVQEVTQQQPKAS